MQDERIIGGSVGIFGHEVGERLLYVLQCVTHQALYDLYVRYGTSQRAYAQSLARVRGWSTNLICEQIRLVSPHAADICLRLDQAFDEYVSSGVVPSASTFATDHATSRPSSEEILHAFLIEISRCRSIVDGHYFAQVPNPILMRFACMDSLRTALYDLITKMYASRDDEDPDIYPSDSVSNFA